MMAMIRPSPVPFLVHLERAEPVHLFDSHTVDIMFDELDTFYDFTSYIVAKEAAIAKYVSIAYAGEETYWRITTAILTTWRSRTS